MSEDRPFARVELQDCLAGLARKGIYIGTSSWKYPGWCGQLYREDRYLWRGRFSDSRFEKYCLNEYGEVFKTVCVDAAYYKFPTRDSLRAMAAQVPEDFLFSFKVTDEITIKKFTNLPRFGLRAGRPNENFLNAELFAGAFLEPCQSIQGKVDLLIFEFSRFYPSDFARGQQFVEALDAFLERLPGGWRYGVEIRNKNFLHPEYFRTLTRHRVTHVYNSWQGMPPVGDQLALPGSRTHPQLVGARFLLLPGRKYQDAVDRFHPYRGVQDPNPEARRAGAKLIDQALAQGPESETFLYINNRLEGNALGTIRAMIDLSGAAQL